jgi:hypothetical protein
MSRGIQWKRRGTNIGVKSNSPLGGWLLESSEIHWFASFLSLDEAQFIHQGPIRTHDQPVLLMPDR